MKLEPVIGLEIHIQLKTATKMFCGCATHDSAVAPNTNVCPICLGHPGVLPVTNAAAVQSGIKVGLALGCKIAEHSKFDRKNYFYPDLPKGYQISQFDLPIAFGGKLTFRVPGGEREEVTVGITRAHLEEDAAKSVHDASGKTYVDYNRGGTPLIEIVTEPDFRTPQEAKAFLQELRLIARYLGISDADMEKGHLRCDANISMRQMNDDGTPFSPTLHPKTEVKNLNSFRHVERALQYEIKRQSELWRADSPPSVSTTRGWNETKQRTEEQRTKEGFADYRYFPEPDIPAMALRSLVEDIVGSLPELPAARRARFMDEYALKAEDARILCEDPDLANFTEATFSELGAWLNALPELDGAEEEVFVKERKKMGKLVSGWLISKLGGLLAERGIGVRTMKITPENFAEFVTLLASGKLPTSAGLTVLNAMLDDGNDPTHIMEDKRLGRVADEEQIADIVMRVLEGNPDQVAAYKDGKPELLQFFIGQVMKETEGAADPGLTRNILLVKLKD